MDQYSISQAWFTDYNSKSVRRTVTVFEKKQINREVYNTVTSSKMFKCEPEELTCKYLTTKQGMVLNMKKGERMELPI